MENQHQLIKGYRNLSADEIELMNDCKELAEACGALIELLRTKTGLDQRWVSIGATSLQQGWMSVIRGIAQPTTF